MLRFKNDVKVGPLCPQMVLALVIVDQIYAACESPECWVTSLSDGRHKIGSLHYSGRAVDLRTKDLELAQRAKIFVQTAGRLRPLGFDVIDEGDHFHIEYDPR